MKHRSNTDQEVVPCSVYPYSICVSSLANLGNWRRLFHALPASCLRLNSCCKRFYVSSKANPISACKTWPSLWAARPCGEHDSAHFRAAEGKFSQLRLNFVRNDLALLIQ